MGKPKPKPHLPNKPPFARKVNKSEIIEAFLHQYLILEEDSIDEDVAKSEDSIEDTSILVDSTIAKNSNPANLRDILSTVYENTPNYNTKINKCSTSAKQLVVDGVICLSTSKHVACYSSTVDRAHNHSLIDCGVNGGASGEYFYVRLTQPEC